MKTKTSEIKEYVIMGIILLTILTIIGYLFFLWEGDWKEQDKVYNKFCNNGLIIYKSISNKSHIDGCYKIENNIITFYKLRWFNNTYYLTESK